MVNGNFGKYEIVRKLSRSMTDVYLARDTALDRPAVLKIIERTHDEFTQLVIEAERRGALIQKQLHATDSRILEIYEYGEQDNCFFVAMEYFPGITLAEILVAERRMDPRRAARYAAEIGSQLKTLHSFISDVDGHLTAVVHGDIKPSNVQIGPNDELRLLDFGIAKVITFTHNLTHHNLGSPSYCSPERISKAQVDPHADLWALGVTLYEMLAGDPPYQAQNTRKLENLIQSRRPPRALPQNCPRPLAAIVSKSLAADLEQRYQSAADFENDLRAFLEDRAVAATRERVVWDANATVEKNPISATKLALGATIRRVKEKHSWKTLLVRASLSNVTLALAAGVLVGLLVFMPLGYYYRFWMSSAPLRASKDYAHADLSSLSADWDLYRALKERNRFLGDLSPVASVERSLQSKLVAAADNIIDSYRNSSDSDLADFDWERARLCLNHALEIQPSDMSAKGKLALCNGYLDFIKNPKPPRASLSIGDFRQAALYIPRSPDPHLALARVYIYGFHNVGEALGEFAQVRQLGYRLGPREEEQEADGYMYRAEWEIDRAKKVPPGDNWLQLAREDIKRARKLYEPIVGFANVDNNLEQVYQDESEQMRLEAENVRLLTPKPRVTKRASGVRRWQ
ncbi:MAG TPA: serine/threonine-protein kinase [Bryobacteraceae bacterium]|jgi:serine/threonine protein kinase|nr:serine/threonine-protein kinase [Bryobacteraceae bacterium]